MYRTSQYYTHRVALAKAVEAERVRLRNNFSSQELRGTIVRIQTFIDTFFIVFYGSPLSPPHDTINISNGS